MTAFNTDYTTTELLDQELTIEELEAVAGGLGTAVNGPLLDADVVIEWSPFGDWRVAFGLGTRLVRAQENLMEGWSLLTQNPCIDRGFLLF